MSNLNISFLVDSSNILWTMDYDGEDNTVTLTSDNSERGTCAIVGQYSMDNALGHDIPEPILSSAQAMIKQDAIRRDPLDYIIDEYAGAPVALA